MRILVLIAIALLLYIILKNIFRKNSAVGHQTGVGEMVRCMHCNLHILEKEAIKAKGGYFCSQEHVEAEQKD